MQLVMTGGWKTESRPFSLDCVANGCMVGSCDDRAWKTDFQPSPPDLDESVVVVMGSGNTSWTMRVKHLYAPRTATLVGPSAVSAGASLLIDWSPESDDGSQATAVVYLVDGGFGEPTMPERGLVHALGWTPGQLTFTVPETLAPGDYVLRLLAPPIPTATCSDGPADCVAVGPGLEMLFGFPFTVR
jgi:hypothetical protein